MPRSCAQAGAAASLLALLFMALVAVAPRAVLAADIDVEVDACSLLDDAQIEGLTAWTDFTTGSAQSSSAFSDCFWGSVRAGEAGYVELVVVRKSSLDPVYSYAADCVQAPVPDVGEEAAFVECPTEVSLFAYERGAVVSLLVDQPAEPLTAADLASVVREVLAQLGGGEGSGLQPPWSPDGTSTYHGAWTITSLAHDGGPDFVEESLGDTEVGTLTVDCTGDTGYCNVTSTRGGEEVLAMSGEIVGEGELRMVLSDELDNCENGQTRTHTLEVSFDSSRALATEAWVTDPRTCTYDDSTLYAVDLTWTFEGELEDFVAPDTGDLASYLTGYGLECTTDGPETRCGLQIRDGDELDAEYRVLTGHDEDGLVVSIVAEAISVDESMPSDAFGFLRGIAERAPVPDGAALAAWLDEAVGAAETPEFRAGDWTATWMETRSDGGLSWSLAIERAGGATASGPPVSSAEPAPAATPPASDGTREPFADAVPTIGEVSGDPMVLLQSGLLAALVVFLMPFPSQLFNSTLETHEDEVRRWLRLDRLGVLAGGIGAFWASWPGVAAFTVLAALLYGFLDPGFGLDLGSVATFLGMLVGIVLVTVAFAIPSVLAHRRHGDRPSLKVVPVSLLIGVACVLLSRLTDFQPGYLYGLLIGLVFARELTAAEEGRATAIGALAMLGVALVSWVGLGALPDGDGFGIVVGRTALAALMVAGLEGVVFGLLPMRFLPGESLYAWNRLLWGTLLATGAFAFFHILINPASGYLSDSSRTPLFTVVALLIGFSLVSVAFWAWFRFRGDHPPAEEIVA